jgi:hypothetical protein
MAHRNSWFPYYKWLFSSSQTLQTVSLPEGIPWNPSWFLQVFPAAKGSSSTPRAALFSSACLRPQGALAGVGTTYGTKLFFKVGGPLAKTHVSWNNCITFPYYITSSFCVIPILYNHFNHVRSMQYRSVPGRVVIGTRPRMEPWKRCALR